MKNYRFDKRIKDVGVLPVMLLSCLGMLIAIYLFLLIALPFLVDQFMVVQP